MEGIFSVESQIDNQFGNEEYIVKWNDNVVLQASRFDHLRDTSVSWDVGPHQSKEDCLLALAVFYGELRYGRYKGIRSQEMIDRGLRPGISFDQDTKSQFIRDYSEQCISLDALLEHGRKSIVEYNRFKDFMLLKVDTIYCAFTMEDFSGTPWKPETGRISVTSAQDISEPLSGLIMATARQSAPYWHLKPTLADLYVYNSKKKISVH